MNFSGLPRVLLLLYLGGKGLFGYFFSLYWCVHMCCVCVCARARAHTFLCGENQFFMAFGDVGCWPGVSILFVFF